MLLFAVVLAFTVFQFTDHAKVSFSSILTDDPNVRQNIVDLHNEVRRNVNPSSTNMLKMMWSKHAGENAADWAEECIMGHSPSVNRKIPNLKCGENIYFSTVPVPWKNAIMSFYREGENLIYGKGSKDSSKAIGHYTQLVWHSSYLVGCAVSKCPRNRMKYMYVCQYCPGGNLWDERYSPYKSGKSCADCPSDCEKNLCTNFCPYQDVYSNCNSFKDQCHKEKTRKNCPSTCRCQGKLK